MTNKPTSETDAVTNKYNANPLLEELCRKIEIERNDWQQAYERVVGNYAKLKKERDALQKAVDAFCKKQEWADTLWKQQPHIAELFRLATKEESK